MATLPLIAALLDILTQAGWDVDAFRAELDWAVAAVEQAAGEQARKAMATARRQR